MTAPVSLGAVKNHPPMWRVHMSLITTQIIFGGGAVVGKFGVSSFNPVLFAMIRECCAGPILLAIAYLSTRNSIHNFWARREDWPLFIVAGFCLFSNQLGFIVGEKLASAVVGSAWQPSQPLFLCLISIALGWERGTKLKFCGIIVAFFGAVFMVITSKEQFGKVDLEMGGGALTGNCLFFFNCLGTALYVIFAKKLLVTYPSVVVTGWSYIFASIQMCISATIINTVPGGVEFVCPPDSDDNDNEDSDPSCEAWAVPTNAGTILPLLYWICFNSIAAYLLMTWGNQFAPPSAVLGYTSLQPLTSSLVTVLIIKFGYTNSDLELPGWNLLGGLLIIVGLGFLIADNRTEENTQNFEIDEDVASQKLIRSNEFI